MKKFLCSATFIFALYFHGIGQTTKALKIAVLVYPGVELLDFSGPVEVLSNVDSFDVFLVSTTEKEVITKHHNVALAPKYTIYNAPVPDILIVPGAPMEVINALCDSTKVINWIKATNAKTSYTVSVCTGAFLLNTAGLLVGKTVTTHAYVIDSLRQKAPKSTVLSNVRWVEDGKILTTAGISAGIDGALRLVQQLKGDATVAYVTGVMQYDYWNPNNGVIVGKKKTSTKKVKKRKQI